MELEAGVEAMRIKHLQDRRKHVSRGTGARMRKAYLLNNEFFV